MATIVEEMMVLQSIAAEKERLKEVKFQGVGHKWSIQNLESLKCLLEDIKIVEADFDQNAVFCNILFRTPCEYGCVEFNRIYASSINDWRKIIGPRRCGGCGQLFVVTLNDKQRAWLKEFEGDNLQSISMKFDTPQCRPRGNGDRLDHLGLGDS